MLLQALTESYLVANTIIIIRYFQKKTSLILIFVYVNKDESVLQISPLIRSRSCSFLSFDPTVTRYWNEID